MNVIAWFLMNAIIVGAWVFLAVHFGKWWIAIFLLFGLFRYKSDDGDKKTSEEGEEHGNHRET